MVIKKTDIYEALRERGIEITTELRNEFCSRRNIRLTDNCGNYFIYIEPGETYWNARCFSVSGEYWIPADGFEDMLGSKILDLFGNKQKGIDNYFENAYELFEGIPKAKTYRAKTRSPTKICAAIESVLDMESLYRKASKNLVELAVRDLKKAGDKE